MPLLPQSSREKQGRIGLVLGARILRPGTAGSQGESRCSAIRLTSLPWALRMLASSVVRWSERD